MAQNNFYQTGPSNVPEFTVSEVSSVLKRTIETAFERVRIRGEISGLSRPASGHLYFKLKDADAVIDGVIWKGTAFRLPIKPEDGMEIVATGKISIYQGSSRYQIIIETVELAGQGALLKLLEDRKKKLAAEGLFDESRKVPIPFLPEVIGVITSPSGAVIRDILHRLRDRFPRRVIVWPVPVQGEGSAELIAAAINGFNNLPANGPIPRPDVLIVARGGGSIEDLWSFNEEIVVRAVANGAIPLISAVGHETDITLIDYVSDRRAPTPTAAAEMAVPVRAQLLLQIEDNATRLNSAITRNLLSLRQKLHAFASGLVDPSQQLAFLRQKLQDKWMHLQQGLQHFIFAQRLRLNRTESVLQPDLILGDLRNWQNKTNHLAQRLDQSILQKLQRLNQRLGENARVMQSLSYERVLDRGFSLIVTQDGYPVTQAAELKAGMDVTIRMADGSADTSVKRVNLKK
jgi:exodeoxyribonuclease VII large subunit